ncbi:hypothetical protein H4219_000906 [Mycoemilia scoparia]|uniref:Protection of telomeres protein 1 ssDNA-binding domain-containing protein n=1 Tax=Mycoemilia scoparia TaxID=417184 RepID=A0A9W8A1M8_9FUNG|nr:hypothetical protein H4219_000906 [Mycoemilia scoparia]
MHSQHQQKKVNDLASIYKSNVEKHGLSLLSNVGSKKYYTIVGMVQQLQDTRELRKTKQFMKPLIITAPDLYPDEMYIAFFCQYEHDLPNTYEGDIIYIDRCKSTVYCGETRLVATNHTSWTILKTSGSYGDIDNTGVEETIDSIFKWRNAVQNNDDSGDESEELSKMFEDIEDPITPPSPEQQHQQQPTKKPKLETEVVVASSVNFPSVAGFNKPPQPTNKKAGSSISSSSNASNTVALINPKGHDNISDICNGKIFDLVVQIVYIQREWVYNRNATKLKVTDYTENSCLAYIEEEGASFHQHQYHGGLMHIHGRRVAEAFVWDSLRDSLYGLREGAFIKLCNAYVKMSKYGHLEINMRPIRNKTKIIHIKPGDKLLDSIERNRDVYLGLLQQSNEASVDHIEPEYMQHKTPSANVTMEPKQIESAKTLVTVTKKPELIKNIPKTQIDDVYADIPISTIREIRQCKEVSDKGICISELFEQCGTSASMFQYKFHFNMKVQDQDGGTLAVVISDKHAERFLGMKPTNLLKNFRALSILKAKLDPLIPKIKSTIHSNSSATATAAIDDDDDDDDVKKKKSESIQLPFYLDLCVETLQTNSKSGPNKFTRLFGTKICG